MQPVKLSGPERLRKWVTGICLIAGPLVSSIVPTIHPKTVNDGAEQLAIVSANLDRWIIAHQLVFIKMILMLPAVLGLAHLLRARRPGTALVGGALAMLGLLAGAGAATEELIIGQMAQVAGAPAQMAALFDRVHSGDAFFVFIFSMVPLLPIGLIILTWGLYRARAIAVWVAGIIIVGAVLETAGLIASPPMTVVGGILQLLGLGWIGVHVLRRTDEEWVQPPVLPSPAVPAPGPAADQRSLPS